MKRLRILSDVATSRGIVHAGPDVVLLDDAEADSCIRHGLAELVVDTAEAAPAPKPVPPPPPKPEFPPNVVVRSGHETADKPAKKKKP